MRTQAGNGCLHESISFLSVIQAEHRNYATPLRGASPHRAGQAPSRRWRRFSAGHCSADRLHRPVAIHPHLSQDGRDHSGRIPQAANKRLALSLPPRHTKPPTFSRNYFVLKEWSHMAVVAILAMIFIRLEAETYSVVGARSPAPGPRDQARTWPDHPPGE